MAEKPESKASVLTTRPLVSVLIYPKISMNCRLVGGFRYTEDVTGVTQATAQKDHPW